VEHEANGVVELEVEASLGDSDGDGWPYGPPRNGHVDAPDARLRLIPYHRWGNRGPATMRVWLPI
jgi:DUF1680 family protein